MKTLNYEINDDDLKKYLKKHKKEELFKYKEALFINYIKNTNGLTKEKIEMLLEKYNISNVNIELFCILHDKYYTNASMLTDFDYHLSNVTRLDISGICHMLIPIIKYNDHNCINRDKLKVKLYSDCLLSDLGFTYVSRERINNCVDEVLDNYSIANKVKTTLESDILLLSKNNSQLEMKSYSQIYGKEVVKTLNDHVNLMYKSIHKF